MINWLADNAATLLLKFLLNTTHDPTVSPNQEDDVKLPPPTINHDQLPKLPSPSPNTINNTAKDAAATTQSHVSTHNNILDALPDTVPALSQPPMLPAPPTSDATMASPNLPTPTTLMPPPAPGMQPIPLSPVSSIVNSLVAKIETTICSLQDPATITHTMTAGLTRSLLNLPLPTPDPPDPRNQPCHAPSPTKTTTRSPNPSNPLAHFAHCLTYTITHNTHYQNLYQTTVTATHCRLAQNYQPP